jgi:thiamine pyrophosphate-dependent acetolactate synthase large subunit-like protein
MLAQAFGVRSWRVDSDTGFADAMKQALATGETAVIEVMVKG